MRSTTAQNATVGSAPIDPAQAVSDLEAAADREQIFALVLRAARSRAPFVALLSVHKEDIRGRKVIADDRFETGSVSAIRIPRDAVAAFEEAIESGFPFIGSIATGNPEIDDLLHQLGGVMPPVAMLLPIMVGERTVALVLGHCGAEPILFEEAADLFPLLSASSRVLERLVNSRADVAAQKPGKRASTAGIEGASDEIVALRQVLEVYRQYESWEELADAIRGLIRIGMERGEPDEDEQLELLIELGSVEADHLERPELAIEAWRSALTIDASDRRVLDALERMFVAHERWEELIDLLERRAAMADELGERVGLLLNIAAFAQERLADDDRAVDALERIVGWQPTNELATRKLEELYRCRAQWQPLTALLVDVGSRHDDPSVRAAALQSAAEIFEQQLGDPSAAFLVWIALLRRDPDRTEGVDALEQLGPAAAAWDDLLPVCETLAEELEPEHAAVASRVWQMIGRWLRDHLGHSEAAAAALGRSLQLDPDDVDVLSELIDLQRALGSPDLATTLSRRAEIELDPGTRAQLYIELGQLQEAHPTRPADAIASYQRAVAAEPESTAALSALRRVHRAHGQWEELAAVLSQLAAALADHGPRAERVNLHLEQGELLGEQLGRPDDAAGAFRAALELDRKNAAAYEGLKRVLRATGRRDAYVEVLEAELDAGESVAEAHRYVEIALEWESRSAIERAARCWEKLLAIDGKHEEAHRGLARTLARTEQWEALAAAHRAHLHVLADAPQRAEVLIELASVLDRVDDVDGAIRTCQDVLALDVDHSAALDWLGRLNERAGQWKEALAALEQLYAATFDERRRSDLQQRIGHIHDSRGDDAAALACFELAISLDRSNAAAHEGLARLFREREQWTDAADHLLRAAEVSSGPDDAVRCLRDAAEIFRDRLGDPAKAGDCLQRILELDPNDAAARHGLGEVLSGAEQWDALWPHLEQMVERIRQDPGASAQQRHDVFTKAARCAVAIGDFAKALELFDLALRIDPADLGVLGARADALYRSGDLEGAAKAYSAIVMQYGAGLDRPQIADLYRRMALIQRALGRVAQALSSYEKVLVIEPKHREALQELAELQLERGTFDEAIASLRELADVVDAPQKLLLLERMGDLYREKMSNTPRAVSMYLQAVDLDPTNHRTLQKLLDVQSEAGLWKDAVETIGRFIAVESDPARRGKYLLAAASIHRFKLTDAASALDHYDRAIEAFFESGSAMDPATRTRALEAFQGIDEIVTAHKDWQRQERSYRSMIKRVSKDDPLAVALWDALGEIYRSRLKHYESAIHSFETAHSLDPAKSPKRVQILAELYGVVGKHSPGQMTDHAVKLVENDPSNPEAYRALARACMDAGRIDEAWCGCRALVFLGQATPAEQEMYQQYQDRELRKARGVLDEDSWGFLRVADEDRVLSSIFALTWEGPVVLRAGPPKSFELKNKEKLQVEDGSRVLAKIFQNSARVLNAPLPHVYVQPDRSGRLLLANCIDGRRLAPTVIVGRDLMTGYRDTELAFAVASMLSLLRPAYYLRLALPTVGELEAALAAAIRLGGKTVAARPEMAQQIDIYVAEIHKRLTPQTAEILRDLVNRLSERPDLARWRNAVDVAAARAGLLICGELSAAARMASAEPAIPGGPRPADKVRDLVAFSVSRSYFAARRHLGVNVA